MWSLSVGAWWSSLAREVAHVVSDGFKFKSGGVGCDCHANNEAASRGHPTTWFKGNLLVRAVLLCLAIACWACSVPALVLDTLPTLLEATVTAGNQDSVPPACSFGSNRRPPLQLKLPSNAHLAHESGAESLAATASNAVQTIADGADAVVAVTQATQGLVCAAALLLRPYQAVLRSTTQRLGCVWLAAVLTDLSAGLRKEALLNIDVNVNASPKVPPASWAWLRNEERAGMHPCCAQGESAEICSGGLQ